MIKKKPRNFLKDWIEFLEEYDNEFLWTKVEPCISDNFPELGAFVSGNSYICHVKKVREVRGDKPRLRLIIGGKT